MIGSYETVSRRDLWEFPLFPTEMFHAYPLFCPRWKTYFIFFTSGDILYE